MQIVTLKVVLSFVMVGLLTACISPSPTPPPVITSVLGPYPVSTSDSPFTGPYPVVTLSPYPGVLPTIDPNIIPFQITRPVVEGTTAVNGTGPAGVPILLEDVTFMGVVLGETTIKPDGTYNFSVQPLERNHRIGITLGILTGTSWKPEDFHSPAYQGPEAMLAPNVGFFYDTVLVQAP